MSTSSGNAKTKPLVERITLWIGVIGSVLTIGLTIWNADMNMSISKREEDLKALEIQLKERSTGVEESKERVERYKWVLSLFPSLSSANQMEKNFATNLIRLALTNEEAEQLFTGLQTSSDPNLQTIGKKGITVIQNEPIAKLITQMNAEKTEVRKEAVKKLEKDYSESSQAITQALNQLSAENINTLSPSGIINNLYFLGNTNANSWNKEQITTAKSIIKNIRQSKIGPQTNTALSTLEALITKNVTGD